MTHTFASLTNRKVNRENTVEGNSTQSVHQERSTYTSGGHSGELRGYELRSIGGEGYMQSHKKQSQTVPRRRVVAASRDVFFN